MISQWNLPYSKMAGGCHNNPPVMYGLRFVFEKLPRELEEGSGFTAGPDETNDGIPMRIIEAKSTDKIHRIRIHCNCMIKHPNQCPKCVMKVV